MLSYFELISELQVQVLLCIKMYGVVKKKINRKSEEKMQLKVKMTLQRAENLVLAQQHLRKHFYKKIFF